MLPTKSKSIESLRNNYFNSILNKIDVLAEQAEKSNNKGRRLRLLERADRHAKHLNFIYNG